MASTAIGGVEGELGYRSNDVDVVTGIGRTGGELNATTLMANVLYDWNVSDRWTLSFGAGAGIAHDQFDDGVLDQDEDYNLAYQGIAGIAYALLPRLDLTLVQTGDKVKEPQNRRASIDLQ